MRITYLQTPGQLLGVSSSTQLQQDTGKKKRAVIEIRQLLVANCGA